MAPRHRPICQRLIDRIAIQHGAFSRRDAISCGHADRDLVAWVSSGAIVQTTRGGYYRPPETDPTWAEASPLELNAEHERRRIRAVLRVTPTFVASHQSALLLHGLPRLQLPDRRAEVWLMATTKGRLVRRAGVHMVKSIPGTVMSTVDPIVAVPDAIAQIGCRQGQLAALIPADAALHDDRLGLDDLDAACQRMSGRRGALHLAGLTSLADGRRESPGETRLFTVLEDAGISATPQVWIHDARSRSARVDFLIDDTKVVLEFDGLSKYDDPAVARGEKKREHRLRLAGYVVIRVIWEDFADIPALVGRIRAAIAHDADRT